MSGSRKETRVMSVAHVMSTCMTAALRHHQDDEDDEIANARMLMSGGAASHNLPADACRHHDHDLPDENETGLTAAAASAGQLWSAYACQSLLITRKRIIRQGERVANSHVREGEERVTGE